MSFLRGIVQDGGLMRTARGGDGLLSAAIITTVAADAADTLTVAKITTGIVQYTGFTLGRVLTTDTAANIIAAFPYMDVGDCYLFKVSVTTANAGTFAAGVGVTLAGKPTVPASGAVDVVVIKTSATTVTFNVL